MRGRGSQGSEPETRRPPLLLLPVRKQAGVLYTKLSMYARVLKCTDYAGRSIRVIWQLSYMRSVTPLAIQRVLRSAVKVYARILAYGLH